MYETYANVTIDPDSDDFELQIDHPSGVSSYGVLVGEATVDGGQSYSGMLFDTGNGVPAVEVQSLVIAPIVA